MTSMKRKLKSETVESMGEHELCVAMILEHDIPYNFFEYEGVGRYVKFLNPNAVLISENLAKADVLKIYMKEKEKLKQTMANLPARISITFDLWTTCTDKSYICLTAQFVDTNWELNSKILNFCRIPIPQSGFELSQKIFEFLKDWGIEKKIFSLTLDNSPMNDNLQNSLKDQLALQNWLLCDGEFFHVHCSAHILNLIVQEGLKVVSDVLYKIRESVKYVTGLESRMEKFRECIEQIGGINTSIGLRLDIPTRWTYTYLMLQSALNYQHVFASLQLNDEKFKNYGCCPSTEEWKIAGKILEFLLPFYDTISLISSSSYPTSNLYFLQIWKIQCVLNDYLRDDDEVIKSMAERMLLEFKKFWDEYSVMLALGAVLDPRMKFSALAYCYSKVDASTCSEKLEHARRKLHILYEKYNNTSNPNVQSGIQTSSMVKESKSSVQRIFREFKMYQRQLATKSGKSQLDVYLDEPNLDLDYYEDLDILKWWRDNNYRFPDLSIMACDLLNIPITTVASEYDFSAGACVLIKYRSGLPSKDDQPLICTRNWLHGFVNDEDVDDGIETRVEPSISEEATNSCSDTEDDVEDGDDE